MKIQLTPVRTYATEANAEKAIEQKGFSKLPYLIVANKEGRFYPIFIGASAIQCGVHFEFSVAAFN